ncbi:hypothetical protein C9439_05590 [archaeon SCG-AAA382B04]|nr:hypothetical protein C9439_05590 [archaeon SCG-AAA382B04]
MKQYLSAILSIIIPGLGQFLQERYLKVVFIYLLFLLSLLMGGFLFTIVAIPIIWIYSITDAYNHHK